MNYYPFHIGDYASATQHLTLEEDGMYRRLLDIIYTTEKPLPKDERQLIRLTRATTEAHREAMLTVLHEFFNETDEGWESSRAMSEIMFMREKQQKQRDKANKRWAKPGPEPGNATAMPRHPPDHATASKGDADAMPPTPTPTPNTSSRDGKPSSKNSADKSKAQLWKSAVSLLEGQGMSEPQARTFIGKLSKDYPDAEIVLKAVEGAVSEQPADARAYLKATCQRLNGERMNGGGTDWTKRAI